MGQRGGGGGAQNIQSAQDHGHPWRSTAQRGADAESVRPRPPLEEALPQPGAEGGEGPSAQVRPASLRKRGQHVTNRLRKEQRPGQGGSGNEPGNRPQSDWLKSGSFSF